MTRSTRNGFSHSCQQMEAGYRPRLARNLLLHTEQLRKQAAQLSKASLTSCKRAGQAADYTVYPFRRLRSRLSDLSSQVCHPLEICLSIPKATIIPRPINIFFCKPFKHSNLSGVKSATSLSFETSTTSSTPSRFIAPRAPTLVLKATSSSPTVS